MINKEIKKLHDFLVNTGIFRTYPSQIHIPNIN